MIHYTKLHISNYTTGTNYDGGGGVGAVYSAIDDPRWDHLQFYGSSGGNAFFWEVGKGTTYCMTEHLTCKSAKEGSG